MEYNLCWYSVIRLQKKKFYIGNHLKVVVYSDKIIWQETYKYQKFLIIFQ